MIASFLKKSNSFRYLNNTQLGFTVDIIRHFSLLTACCLIIDYFGINSSFYMVCFIAFTICTGIATIALCFDLRKSLKNPEWTPNTEEERTC